MFNKLTRKGKGVLCLLLSSALFVTAIPFTFHAEVKPIGSDVKQNLAIENWDFEETGKDVPGWSLYSGELNSHGDSLEISTDTSYTGTHSLKFTSTIADDYPEHGAFSKPIYGFKAGYTYQAKAMIKGTYQRVVFYVYYYDMYCHYLSAYATEHNVGSNSTNWHEYVVTGTAPAGAAFARIYIRAFGTGTFYADTVSMTEMPFLTNASFTDGTNGWTTVDDGLLSDAVKVQGGMSYALTGDGKENNSIATLIYYNPNGVAIQEHTQTVAIGEHMAIKAFAPANAATMKVKVSGSNAFSNLSLKPAANGTQVSDGSFESILNATGTTWTTTGYLAEEDFEGTNNGKWTKGYYNNPGTLTWTTETAHGGSGSLKIDTTMTAGGNGAISTLMAVEAGVSYDFTMFYKSTMKADFYVEYWPENPSIDRYNGTSNRIVGRVYSGGATDEWTQMKFSDVAPEGAKYMTLLLLNNGMGVSYLDDVEIKQAGPLVGKTYLEFGEGFEGTDNGEWTKPYYRHGGEITWTDENTRTGNGALKIDTTPSNASSTGAISKLMPVEAGKTYDILAYYSSNLKVTFYVDFWPEEPQMDRYGGANNRVSGINFSGGAATEWTQIKSQATAPEDAKYMTVMILNGGSGISYIDDLSIKETGATSTNNALSTEVVVDGSTGIKIANGIANSSLVPVMSGKEYATIVTAKGDATLKLTYYDKNNQILAEHTKTTNSDAKEVLRIDSVAPLYAFNAKITLISETGIGYYDCVDMYAITDSVSNYSFEDINRYYAVGTFPNQWRTSGNIAAMSVSDVNAPNSVMILQVYGVDNGSVYSSYIRAEENTAYMARIMASSAEGGSLRLAFFDENFKFLGNSAATAFSGTTWTKYTVTGTSPANTAYAVVEIVADANDAFLLDSVEFSEKAVEIGNNTQMFIDDYMIETAEGFVRTFHQGEKTEPLKGLDVDPWEVNGSYIYGTVLYDEDEEIYKMWYQSYNASNATGGDGAAVMACYATSVDGVTWHKPNLGLVSYQGNKNNNLVGNYHIMNIFKDYEETNPAKRYKMITYSHDNRYSTYYSADGLVWTKDAPFLTGNDVITANWDANKQQYYAVMKLNTNSNNRDFYTMTGSSDINQWKVPVMSNSLSDALDTKEGYSADCYGMGLYEKDGNYIGLIWQMYIPGYNGMEGLFDIQLAYSRDLMEEWQRPTRTPILPRGEEGTFDDGCINTASMIFEMDDELWMYMGSMDGDHGTAQRDASLYIAKWRMDGFASMDAENNGVLQTKAFTFDGKYLRLNANAIDGEILVEIVDANGNPIPGFTKEDAIAITSDSVRHTVAWKNGNDVSSLEGETVALRIYAKDSDVYSFEFTDTEASADQPAEKFTNTVTAGEGGSATVSRETAPEKASVTVTVKANEGYELDTITVKDANGKDVTFVNNGDDTYTYKMPNSNVSINVTFKEVDDSLAQTGNFNGPVVILFGLGIASAACGIFLLTKKRSDELS